MIGFAGTACHQRTRRRRNCRPGFQTAHLSCSDHGLIDAIVPPGMKTQLIAYLDFFTAGKRPAAAL